MYRAFQEQQPTSPKSKHAPPKKRVAMLHDEHMRYFNKLFVKGFNFNDNMRAHVKLKDRPSMFKIESSLRQDTSLYFLFRKKHHSESVKQLTVDTEMAVTPKVPLTIESRTYFNFFFDVKNVRNV